MLEHKVLSEEMAFRAWSKLVLSVSKFTETEINFKWELQEVVSEFDFSVQPLCSLCLRGYWF